MFFIIDAVDRFRFSLYNERDENGYNAIKEPI